MNQREVALGSQFYINRDTTIEQVDSGIAAMAAHGLRLVRIFAIWDHLEPRPGCYDWSVYDALFDAAAEHHIGVIPTLFAVSPPGWMNLSNDSQALGPLEDDAYWQAALEHVAKVVQHWRGHPALHSWILWNEPSRVPPETPAVRARWQAFLQEHYGSLQALNAQRYRQAPDWASAAAAGGEQGSAFRGFEHACDRLRFAVAELMHWLRQLAQEVRALDPDHPIHVNPHNVGCCVLAAGQSTWQEGDVVDFIGVSAHPPWHSTRFPAWRVPHSIEFFADIARSASRDPNRFWVSELQGGPTLYSAEHSSGPDAGDLRRWLAHALASGAEGTLFWCFNQRSGGFEVGEWGLIGLDGRPTARLQAVAETCRWVQRHQALLASARPWPASIAILHSEDSERLQAVVGRGDAVNDPRNRNAHWDAIAGAWLLCRDAGLEVMLVDEDRWLGGDALPESVQTVIVPAASALSPASAARLRDFAAAGGRVIADGLCGWNDSAAHRGDASAHAALFACDLHDVCGVRPELPAASMETSGMSAWLFQGVLHPLGAHCVALDHWPDGSPGICLHRCGSGQVYRIATLVFAAYLAAQHQPAGDVDLRRSLLPLLAPGQALPITLRDPAPGLWIRRLRCGQDCLCMLVNHGGPTTAQVELAAAYDLDYLDHDAPGDAEQATRAIPMPAGATRWLLARRR